MERRLRFCWSRACGLLGNPRIIILPALLLAFLACPKANTPPATPTFVGAIDYGLRDSTYSFSVAATDPEGDSVSFQVVWGDSTPHPWSNPVASGESITIHKSWPRTGVYVVRVQGRDARGAVSEWSPDDVVHIVAAESLPLAPSPLEGPESLLVGFVYDFTSVLNGPAGEEQYFEVVPGTEWDPVNFTYANDEGKSGDTIRIVGYAQYPVTDTVCTVVTDLTTHRVSPFSAAHRIIARNPPVDGWWKSYPEDEVYALAVTADGGLILTGYRGDSSFMARTDGAGNLLWSKVVDDSAWWGLSVQQASDLGFIVLSDYYRANGQEVASIVRTDSGGAVLWRRRYNSQWTYDDCPAPEQIRVTADGGCVIAEGDALMKLDANGDSLWTVTAPANSVVPAPDGQLLLCGQPTGEDTAQITALDQSGNPIWQRTLGRTGTRPARICRTSDGSYMIGGDVLEDSVYLAKVDGAGALIWERFFWPDGAGGASVLDIAPTADGGCYLLNLSDWPEVLRVDANGSLLWRRLAGVPDQPEAYCVATMPDNGFVVGGSLDSAMVYKFDANGYGPAPERSGMALLSGHRHAHRSPSRGIRAAHPARRSGLPRRLP